MRTHPFGEWSQRVYDSKITCESSSTSVRRIARLAADSLFRHFWMRLGAKPQRVQLANLFAEPLESRQYLTAVTLTGTSGNDSFLAQLNTSTNNVDFYVNSTPTTGSPVQSVPLSQLTAVSVDGGGGDDTLIVNATGANFTLDASGTTSLALGLNQGSVTINSAQSLASVNIASGATFVVDGDSASLNSPSITVNGSFVHNEGPIDTTYLAIGLTGVFTDAGGSIGDASGVMINNAGAFDANFDASLAGTTGTFNDAGTYAKNNTTGITTIGMTFAPAGGTLDVDSGTVALSGTLSISGTGLTINGSGTLSASYIGPTMPVTQLGATVDVSTFNIGSTYTLAGGTFNVGTFYVGVFCTGTFVQSGGTLNSTHTEIGSYGNGILDQTGGTANLTGGVYLGAGGGTGAYNISGGTTSIDDIENGFAGTGTVTVSSDGNLTAGYEELGYYGGTGNFDQTGGTNATPNLYVGSHGNGTGNYSLSGGTLSTQYEYVGFNYTGGSTSVGTFTQSGGSNYATAGITLGYSSGPESSGAYNMSGGLASFSGLGIGSNGAASIFTQTNGTVEVSGNTLINGDGTYASTYNLDGGSFTTSYWVILGWSGGTGVFDQQGGQAVDGGLFDGGLQWGGNADSGTGSYTLAGLATLTTGSTYIGYDGTGSFTQTGGTDTAIDLFLNGPAGGRGMYNGSGSSASTSNGTLSITGEEINVLDPPASGPEVQNEGALYTLNLAANANLNPWPYNSWKVVWGEGANSTANGNPSSLEHYYYIPTAPNTPDVIQASAYTESNQQGSSFNATPIPLTVLDVGASITPSLDPSLVNGDPTYSISAGDPLAVQFDFYDPGIYETHTATIQWGDGTTTTNAQVTEHDGYGVVDAIHAYDKDGSASGTITVTDNYGASSLPYHFNVTVGYVAPTFNVTPPTPVTVGQSTSLTLIADGAEAADVSGWQIDWGDGDVSTYPNMPITTPDSVTTVPSAITLDGFTDWGLDKYLQLSPVTSSFGASDYDITNGNPFVAGTTEGYTSPDGSIVEVGQLTAGGLGVFVYDADASDIGAGVYGTIGSNGVVSFSTSAYDGDGGTNTDQMEFGVSPLGQVPVGMTAIWKPTHTYSAAGTYTIEATPTDSGSPHDAYPATADVLNPLEPASGLSSIESSSTDVDLSWNYAGTDETGFYIYASTNGGAFSKLPVTVPAGDGTDPVTYDVQNLTPNTPYTFYVVAFTNSQTSSQCLPYTCSTSANSDPLTISGPDSAQAGQMITLSESGGTFSNETYIWSITANGTALPNGDGSTFDLDVSSAGAYVVNLTGLDGSGKAETAPALSIVATQPTTTVTIVGPTNGTASADVPSTGTVSVIGGHGGIFTAQITPAPIGPVTYSWQLYKADRTQYQPDDPYPSTVSSSFVATLPYEDNAGSDGEGNEYTLTLTMSGAVSQTVSETLQVLQDPAINAFITTVTPQLPIAEGPPALAVDPVTGDLVEAVFSNAIDSDSDSNVISVYRFTPNLQPDPTFGGGTGEVTLPPLPDYESPFPPYEDPEPPHVVVSPVDESIIVLEGFDVPQSGSAENGYFALYKLSANGQKDSSFGTDGLDEVSVPNPSPDLDADVWQGVNPDCGSALSLMDDGDILIGGGTDDVISSQWIYPADGPEEVQTSVQEDWVVSELTQYGTPDPAFNHSQPVEFAEPAPIYTVVGLGALAGTCVQSLIPTATGQIIVAGTVYPGADAPTDPETDIGGFGLQDDDVAVGCLNANGTLDTSFGSSSTRGFYVNSSMHSLIGAVLQPSGDIALAGTTVSRWMGGDLLLVALNGLESDDPGTPDTSFGGPNGPHTGEVDTGITVGISSSTGGWGGLATDVDGNLTLSYQTASGSQDGWDLARFTSDGIPDSVFNSSSPDGVIGVSSPYFVQDPAVGPVVVTTDGIFAVALVSPEDTDPIGPDGTTTLANGYYAALIRYNVPYANATDLAAGAYPDGSIGLQWENGPGSDADGITVFRAVNNGSALSFAAIASVNPDQTTFLDTTAAAGVTYTYYVVPFVGDAGGSVVFQGPSNQASATTAPLNTSYVLQDIVPVDLYGATTQSDIVLDADALYMIEATGDISQTSDSSHRGDAEYGGAQFTSFSGDSSFVPDYDFGIGLNDLKGVKSVYWGMKATDVNHTYDTLLPGNGQKLNIVYHDDYYPDNTDSNPGDIPLQIRIYRAVPSAPGVLAASADQVANAINLSWENLATNGTAILVERSANGGAFSQIASLPPTADSYTDTGAGLNDDELAPNVSYAYRVRVQGALANSDYSNTAYSALIYLAPVVEAIPAQIAYQGTPFSLTISAQDPVDPNAALTYSVVSDPNSTGLGQDTSENAPAGLIDGWTPSANAVPGTTYFVTVRVAEADTNFHTDELVSITIAPPLSTIPDVTSITPATDADPSKLDLTATVNYDGPLTPDQLTYTWTDPLAPSGATPLDFPASQLSTVTNPDGSVTITVTDTVQLPTAGPYEFNLQVSDGTDWYGSKTVGDTVTPLPTSVGITPASPTVELGAEIPLTATLLDQFGNPCGGASVYFTWTFVGADAGSAGSLVAPPSAWPAVTSGSEMVYQAPSQMDSTSSASIEVTYHDRGDAYTPPFPYYYSPTNPPFTIQLVSSGAEPPTASAPSVQPINATQLQLSVAGHDPITSDSDSDLIYTWIVASGDYGAPMPQFNTNGTNAAANAIATFAPNALLEHGYTFTCTITNPDGEFITKTVEYNENSYLSQVVLDPAQSSVGQGKSITYTATAEDQYGVPMASQSYVFTWKLDGQAVTGDTSNTYTYTSNGDDLGQHLITASITAGDTTFTTPVDSNDPNPHNLTVVGSGPTIMMITSPGGNADGSAEEIDSDVPVDIIAFNPDGDPQPWALWLVPTGSGGDETGGGPILLANGAASAGSPGLAVEVTTLMLTMLSSGNYNLQLSSSGIDSHVDVADTKLLNIIAPPHVQVGILTSFTPQTGSIVQVSASGEYIIPSQTDRGYLVSAELQAPEDDDQPFVWGSDYVLQENDDGTVTAFLTSPAPYVLQTSYLSSAGAITTTLTQLDYGVASAGTDLVDPINSYIHVPVPHQDLIIVDDALSGIPPNTGPDDNGMLHNARVALIGAHKSFVQVNDIVHAEDAINQFRANLDGIGDFGSFTVAIIGHGSPGLVGIGGGENSTYAAGQILDLSPYSDLSDFTTTLSLDNVGGITFYECEVGRDSPGVNTLGTSFLKAIAKGGKTVAGGWTSDMYVGTDGWWIQAPATLNVQS